MLIDHIILLISISYYSLFCRIMYYFSYDSIIYILTFSHKSCIIISEATVIMLKIKLPDVEKLPGIILKIGLPVIVISLIYIAFYTYSQTIAPDSLNVNTIKEVSLMLEHTLMSLALILGGSLLANTIPER
jgi:hypothetical protein